jgi:predicted O-methyltransferase YrrM
MNEKRICLNRSVLDFMESILTPESFVLEIGGGYSTRWFAERCFQLVTVETNAKWRRIIQNEMMAPPYNRCHFTMGSTIETANDWTGFDLALVDCVEGQRHKAARYAWRGIEPGGWLVFDDAQRKQHNGIIGWLTLMCDKYVGLSWQPGDIESAKERVAIAFQKG